MSYTTKTVWLDSPELTITAFGKGAAFEVTFKGSGNSAFFQGDAAEGIADIIDALGELDSLDKVNACAYIALSEYDQ